MRQYAAQIDKAKTRSLKRGERNGAIESGWWRESKDVSYLAFKKKAISSLETSADPTDKIYAGLLEPQLRLFEHDVASNVNHTFLDYTPCSDEGDREEGNHMQPAHLGTWIATAVTCLVGLEKRGGRRKIYMQIYTYLDLLRPLARI